MRLNFARLALVGLSVAALAAVGGAQAAPSARSTPATTYYPNILDDFHSDFAGQKPGGLLLFSLTMVHLPSPVIRYRELRPNDIIPEVRLQLSLPAGASIVKRRAFTIPPNNGKFFPRYSATNFRWQTSNGHLILTFRKLVTGVFVQWAFYIKVPTTSQAACISAVATFPGVKHAPKQPTNPTGCSPAG